MLLTPNHRSAPSCSDGCGAMFRHLRARRLAGVPFAPMIRGGVFVPALALAFVFAATGCGGSPYKGLAKAEFISQADAICNQAHQDEAAATKDVPATASV